jgi:hypothetical protein
MAALFQPSIQYFQFLSIYRNGLHHVRYVLNYSQNPDFAGACRAFNKHSGCKPKKPSGFYLEGEQEKVECGFPAWAAFL